MLDRFKGKWTSYLFAGFGVAALTAILIPLRDEINTTTIGFAYLLVVPSVAIIWGSRPALMTHGGR